MYQNKPANMLPGTKNSGQTPIVGIKKMFFQSLSHLIFFCLTKHQLNSIKLTVMPARLRVHSKIAENVDSVDSQNRAICQKTSFATNDLIGWSTGWEIG